MPVGKGAYTLVKVLLLGDSGVGKTALARRIAGEAFTKAFKVTVGVDFKVKELVVGHEPIKVQIWDTAGQERFRSVATNYYRKAAGVLLVYDVNSQESFENIEGWLSLIREHADESITIVLVGNKSDLKANDKKEPVKAVVSPAMGKALADKHKMMFIETSARTDMNVQEALYMLIKEIQRTENPCLVKVDGSNKSEVRISVLGELEDHDVSFEHDDDDERQKGSCRCVVL